MVEVIATDEFAGWYGGLDDGEVAAIDVVVERLQRDGLTLGEPHSSAIHGSRHALRELRPKQGRSPLRVFYVFDPQREAVLLIGGDKSGESSARFYGRMVPQADAIFDEYLAEQARGEHPGPVDVDGD